MTLRFAPGQQPFFPSGPIRHSSIGIAVTSTPKRRQASVRTMSLLVGDSHNGQDTVLKQWLNETIDETSTHADSEFQRLLA